MRVFTVGTSQFNVGSLIESEHGIEYDTDGNAYRQMFSGDDTFHAITTWVSKQGLVRSRYYNAWSHSWEWDRVREPCLSTCGSLMSYVTWKGKSRRMRLERAVALAWVELPTKSGHYVSARLDKAMGYDATNIGWTPKGRSEENFTSGLIRSASCPPRAARGWQRVRYVIYDTWNDPVVHFLPTTCGPLYVNDAGWFKDADGNLTRGHRCVDGVFRLGVSGLGLIRVDRAVMFTFKAQLPFCINCRDGNLSNTRLQNLEWDGRLQQSATFRGTSDTSSCFESIVFQEQSMSQICAERMIDTQSLHDLLYEAANHRPIGSIPQTFWAASLQPSLKAAFDAWIEQGHPVLGCTFREITASLPEGVMASPAEVRLAKLYARKQQLRKSYKATAGFVGVNTVDSVSLSY